MRASLEDSGRAEMEVSPLYQEKGSWSCDLTKTV